MHFVKKSLFSLLFIGIAFQAIVAKEFDWQKEIHWNWSSIDAMNNDHFWHSLVDYFPKDFAWGVATSAFQMEGTQSANGKHCQNSWTIQKNLPQPGISTGHWERYKEDVQLIKNIGMTHYRFSI